MSTLVWFRDDLRVSDHPALSAAVQDGEGVVALYVLDEESDHCRPLGAAAKWWLHHSLSALTGSLERLGIQLVLRRGPANQVVSRVAQECAAERVTWNRRYGANRHHDATLKSSLSAKSITVNSFPGDLLFEPWNITTKEGSPYRVYSPFWRACATAPVPASPLPVPPPVARGADTLPSDSLTSWNLLPTAPDWSAGLKARWTPGEAAAGAALEEFFHHRLAEYSQRDFPDKEVGSELSPHLRWGEISPRSVWHHEHSQQGNASLFLSELGWREFAKHTDFHFGPLHTHNLNQRFDTFPWRSSDGDELQAWQSGTTGFGLVDAGMQELWQTGFMHNRVRMVTASFLTKNLLLDWRIGEAWFWDTLVDADEASNPFNWQWVAGCGADAAPYFRIFNPELQQKKFDPHGRYVTRWAPMSATPQIVDLPFTRKRALQAYETLPR